MKGALGVGIVALLLGFTTGTSCPDRWLAFQGSCYLIGHHSKCTFLEGELSRNIPSSQAKGSNSSSFLTNVRNEVELEPLACEDGGVHKITVSLYTLVCNFGSISVVDDSFWLGLSDMDNEGTWVWYDNSKPVSFTNWFPGEPNSYKGQDEDCALFWEVSNFEWVDAPCSAQAEPVCELIASLDNSAN